jgi:hypothetical protein
VIEYGDILDESQKDLENGMVFRLNPEVKDKKDKKDDDQMWASASSSPIDLFFADE